MNQNDQTPGTEQGTEDASNAAMEAGAATGTDGTANTTDEPTEAAKLDLTAAEAATDTKLRLNAYEQWQQKWEGDLMDGTVSQHTYIRVATGDGIEYGLQPRIQPHPQGMVLTFRARVAHVVRKVASGDEPMNIATSQASSMEEADAKVQALRDFVGGFSDWHKEDPSRVSRIFSYLVPLKPHTEGALGQFLALFDNGLWDKMIGALPTPAAGWDYSELRRAKTQYLEYLQLTANQFGIFNTVVITENKWEDDTAVAVLNEDMVAFLNAIDAPQEGGAADS